MADGRDADQFQKRHGTCAEQTPRNRAGVPQDELWRRSTTTWEEDGACRQLVAENADGMTLDDVGLYFGLTRERTRQVEGNALRKLKLRGITPDMLSDLARHNPEEGMPE